jgi:hypothetical protein
MVNADASYRLFEEKEDDRGIRSYPTLALYPGDQEHAFAMTDQTRPLPRPAYRLGQRWAFGYGTGWRVASIVGWQVWGEGCFDLWFSVPVLGDRTQFDHNTIRDLEALPAFLLSAPFWASSLQAPRG